MKNPGYQPALADSLSNHYAPASLIGMACPEPIRTVALDASAADAATPPTTGAFGMTTWKGYEMGERMPDGPV
jgi:hypothetical protein